MAGVFEFINLVDQFSNPMKLAWLACLVWFAVQIVWYRRARVESDTVEPDFHEPYAAVPDAIRQRADRPRAVEQTFGEWSLDRTPARPAAVRAPARPSTPVEMPEQTDSEQPASAAAVWAAAFPDTADGEPEQLLPAEEAPEPEPRRRRSLGRRNPAADLSSFASEA